MFLERLLTLQTTEWFGAQCFKAKTSSNGCNTCTCVANVTFSRLYEPRHEISNNVVCATSKGSDQPAHTRSLIRAFASRLNILLILSYLNIL